MFGSRHQGTVIGKELKIVGSVTADGLVWLYGQIDGELHCSSLVIDNAAHVSGTVAADRVVVDGKVVGLIEGGEVVLKSRAQVVGDLYYQSLAIESGASFDGRLLQARGNGQTAEKLEWKPVRQVEKRESLCRRIERAVPMEFDIATLVPGGADCLHDAGGCAARYEQNAELVVEGNQSITQIKEHSRKEHKRRALGKGLRDLLSSRPRGSPRILG
jgi:cytoskeletal protein CcmA (bactofilin family)